MKAEDRFFAAISQIEHFETLLLARPARHQESVSRANDLCRIQRIERMICRLHRATDHGDGQANCRTMENRRDQPGGGDDAGIVRCVHSF